MNIKKAEDIITLVFAYQEKNNYEAVSDEFTDFFRLMTTLRDCLMYGRGSLGSMYISNGDTLSPVEEYNEKFGETRKATVNVKDAFEYMNKPLDDISSWDTAKIALQNDQSEWAKLGKIIIELREKTGISKWRAKYRAGKEQTVLKRLDNGEYAVQKEDVGGHITYYYYYDLFSAQSIEQYPDLFNRAKEEFGTPQKEFWWDLIVDRAINQLESSIRWSTNDLTLSCLNDAYVLFNYLGLEKLATICRGHINASKNYDHSSVGYFSSQEKADMEQKINALLGPTWEQIEEEKEKVKETRTAAFCKGIKPLIISCVVLFVLSGVLGGLGLDFMIALGPILIIVLVVLFFVKKEAIINYYIKKESKKES